MHAAISSGSPSPASALKINATFLKALARIAGGRRGRSVEFVFLRWARRAWRTTIWRGKSGGSCPARWCTRSCRGAPICERLGGCAFFLCPFPYGNMNSIVDAVVMGLPGVCLDGADLHAHADVAIFRQLGLPDALCASTEDEYVARPCGLWRRAWLGECREIVSRRRPRGAALRRR